MSIVALTKFPRVKLTIDFKNGIFFWGVGGMQLINTVFGEIP